LPLKLVNLVGKYLKEVLPHFCQKNFNFKSRLTLPKNYSLKSIPKGVQEKATTFYNNFVALKLFFRWDFCGGQKLNENLQVYEMQHIHFNTNGYIESKDIVFGCKISH
jgi:hypothetical protein